jgi:hypothetical protein
MNIRIIALAFACFGLTTTTVLADEEIHTKIVISVKDDGGGDDVYFELDSDEIGFNLHDMQVGENRSIIDKSGKSILVTREENGYRFDVDGKTVNMPVFDGEHDGAISAVGGAVDDVDIHVMRLDGQPHMRTMTSRSGMPEMEGVMIISEKSIDDATQQQIKTLLESTGHGSDVRFVGGDQGHGGLHGVRVIEKSVDLTN